MGNHTTEVMLSLLLLAVVPLTLSAPQYERASCTNYGMSGAVGKQGKHLVIDSGDYVEGYEMPYAKGMADVQDCEASCKDIDECHVFYYTYDAMKEVRSCYLYQSADIDPKDNDFEDDHIVWIWAGSCQ